jgi:hypothetical protein
LTVWRAPLPVAVIRVLIRAAVREGRGYHEGQDRTGRAFCNFETLDDSRGFFPDRIWAELKARLLDLHDNRLRLIDEYGIEMILLSLNAPASRRSPIR